MPLATVTSGAANVRAHSPASAASASAAADKIPGTYSPGRTISVARATTTIDPIASPDPGSAPAVPIKITRARPLFGERALHPRGRRDKPDTDGATDERAELRRIRGNQQRAHIFYDSLAPSSMPKLIYHDSDGLDKVLMLGSEPILIGRATECQVQTQDAMVSRRHARIFWDGNYWIEDLGSSNGVYVGNDKVQKAPFRPGDTVTCGSLVLRLMPDTSPRMTGSNMAPMAQAPHIPARSQTPPVGSNVFAGAPARRAAADGTAADGALRPSPPMAPPPAAAPPLAATIAPPPPRGDVQVGPNAVLRGAVAAPHAMTGAQSSLGEELRLERQRRSDAERAFEEATKDVALLKRKLDQAQADLKRMRGGQAPVADETRDDGELQLLRGRVAELQAQLQRARTSDAGVQMATNARPAADPATADAAIALGDSLAELRASLRAANDEAGLLTAPAESVQVVGEALRSAAEQLEAARGYLRALGKLLGVS